MADEKVTVIDAQAEVEGKLKGKDAVVQGRLKGEIALSGRLVIAEGARVEATITADAVEIAGELRGDVKSRALTLAEKARVQGTLDVKVLVVREGAWLSGAVATGEKAAHVSEKPAQQPVSPVQPPPQQPAQALQKTQEKVDKA
jgi:cytoskeletal protein CcmA (bactofilin family)